MDNSNHPNRQAIVLALVAAALAAAACMGTSSTQAGGNGGTLVSPPSPSPMVLDRLVAEVRAGGADFYSKPQIEDGQVADVVDGRRADVNGHLEGGQPVVLEARTSDGKWLDGAVSGGEYGGYGGWFRAEDLRFDVSQELLGRGSEPLPVPSPQLLLAVEAVTARPTLTPTATYPPAHATGAADDATRAPIETQVAAYVATNNAPLPVDLRLAEATRRAMVDATRCAVAPPPTSTPLPFQVGVTPLAGEVPQTRCTGSGVWLDGRWQDGDTFLTDATVLGELHRLYEQYLDFISFQNSPPSDNFHETLAGYIQLQQYPDYMTNRPAFTKALTFDSLGYVAGEIRDLFGQGYYIRVTKADDVQWNDTRVFLTPLTISDNWQGTPITPRTAWVARLAWTADFRRELVEAKTGKVVKVCQRQRVFGEPSFLYDPDRKLWVVAGESPEGGLYGQFLNNPFGVKDYGFGKCL